MVNYGNDSITVNTLPVNLDEEKAVDFTEMNMLFYYEIKSTKS